MQRCIGKPEIAVRDGIGANRGDLAVRALVASLALNLESILVGGVIDPTQIDLIRGNHGSETPR